MGTTAGGAVRGQVALAAAVVGLSATLLLPGSAAAHSVPQPDYARATASGSAGVPNAAANLLERRVRQRERALDSLEQQAATYEQVQVVEVARLAALGYTGDLSDLTHVLPLADYAMSAGFGLAGPHWKHAHTGQDFAGSLGTSLVAVGDAAVTSVGDSGAYGLRTVLTLEDGTEVWYCHQLTAFVTGGDTVEVGQPIGLLGSTGNSTGPHLHLEVRPAGVGPIDPMPWLAALGLQP
ncbi:M23 family metallopeptidase [Nocardioides sp. LHG3406-4]|uniref:M23 family metallopeptidase n=1 Tax=Nocardioides sp. LHG3406-4 TaxID=2804575 RepID=UPI003CE90CF1